MNAVKSGNRTAERRKADREIAATLRAMKIEDCAAATELVVKKSVQIWIDRIAAELTNYVYDDQGKCLENLRCCPNP